MCKALNHIEQKSENVLFSFLVMCSTFLGGWGGLVGGGAGWGQAGDGTNTGALVGHHGAIPHIGDGKTTGTIRGGTKDGG